MIIPKYCICDETPTISQKYNLLVVPVDFPDKQHSNDLLFYGNLIFNRINHYLNDASYGKVGLQGTVIDWIKAPENLSLYGSDDIRIDQNVPLLIDSTVHIVSNTLRINLSRYDLISIIHAGSGQETSNESSDIWTACWNGLSIQIDTTTISTVVILPEFEEFGVDLLGPYAHELLHALDFSDVDGNMGQIDIMGRAVYHGKIPGSLPPHPSAFQKIKIGWIEGSNVKTVMKSGVFPLSPIEYPIPGTYLVIRIPLETKIYYLIELRFLKYDMDTLVKGLAVTYINENLDFDSHNTDFIPLKENKFEQTFFTDQETGLEIQACQSSSNVTFVEITFFNSTSLNP
jgi:M6 family metalloprotease-like protein